MVSERWCSNRTGIGNGNSQYRSWKVCVIGAGPAGLVTARELRREGHQVIVYEQNEDVGGTWLYEPRIEGDDPQGLKVHSSVYASLRLNSSRETMGFTDYPFVVKEGRDCRRFPGHRELLLYLKDFTRHFGILDLINFNTKVEYVGMRSRADPDKKLYVDDLLDASKCGSMDKPVKGSDWSNIEWVVRSRRRTRGCSVEEEEEEDAVEEIFDGVVVCNGHYSYPRMAQIPGMQRWPGKQTHSHSYRIPDPFRGEIVVVIGNSQSGQDISLELLNVAKEVHLSARSVNITGALSNIHANHLNFQMHPVVESLHENGTVLFQDGASVVADSIIYCTGYSYTFPFLDTKGIVTVDDDRVGPLYEHIFPPLLAPSLSFVGIPRKIIAFPFFESQSKWIAHILSGKAVLPSRKDMMKAVEVFYGLKEAAGFPKHSTHDIADFEYCDWLADQAGCPRLEEWRKEITLATLRNAESNLQAFRDAWDDQYWLELALLS